MQLNTFLAGIPQRFVRLQRAESLFAQSAAALLLSLALILLFATAAAGGQTPRVTLETLPAHALDAAVDLGPMPSSQRLSLTLTLAQTPARQAALDTFLSDLSTASSANYRKWITPAQFALTYGATADQIAGATAWAQSQGLTVESISPSGSRIAVSGFPAQLQATFAVSLHQVQIAGHNYVANLAQPSLTPDAAALFSSVQGLDDLPGSPVTALAAVVDGNTTPILVLDSTTAATLASPSARAAFKALFRQAAAQGITTLAGKSSGIPSDLPEVTSIAHPGDAAPVAASTEDRPAWQVAEGLPADGVRHYPDVTVSTTSAFASTLTSIAASLPGGRLGNLNPVLYHLAPEAGIFTQPAAAAAGTWEPATGLGTIDLAAFAKAFPRGTGSSYASFAASNYSSTHGQSITFTSSVTSGTGGGTPTGTVSFMTSTGATIGTAALTSGTATYSTSSLAGGSYTITANYSGDGSYAPAVSPSGTIFIQPETSQLATTISTGNVVGGSYTVTVTDTAASGVGTPSGNITVMLSGTGTNYTQALTPQGTNSSTTTFTIPATTVGTLTLSINCSGDLSFSCYNALTRTVTVAKATPVLNFSFTPNPVSSGATVTLNATMAAVGTAPVPTGTVTFYDGTTVLNAGTLTNGTTSVTGTVPNSSTHTLTATYNGDADYNSVNSTGSATPSSVATLVATSSASSGAPGSTVTVSGAVTFAGTPQAGVILAATNFPAGGTTNFSGALTTTGANTASFSIPVTVPSTSGSYTISVGCASTDSFTCNTISLPLSSTTASGTTTTTTTITSSGYVLTYGQGFTLTAGVVPAAQVKNTAPTGSVTFSGANGTISGTATLTGSLANLAVTTPISPGAYTFTATYNGDSNYAPSTSAASTAVVISPAAATVSATINPSTVGTGASTTVSANVSIPSGVFPPNGTVVVTVPGVTGAVYTGTLTATGTSTASANVAVPAPPAGTYALQVTCGNSVNFSCNTATVSLTSTATAASRIATTTALTLSPTALSPGVATTLTATVTPASTGSAALSGTVSFNDGTTLLGTGTIANGVATLAYTFTGTAAHNLTAVYSGDTLYATSTSTPVVVSLTLLPVTVTLTSSSAGGVAGSNITLTAQVSGLPATTSPTGKVTFYLSGTTPSAIGTATLAAAGAGLSVATLNTASIPSGTQSVYAVYSGDTIYSPGSSGTLGFGLSNYAVVFTPASLTLTPGETGTVTMQVNTTGGFTGTIALGCVPPGNVQITCSVIPAVLTASGTATLNIFTVAPKLKAANQRLDLKAIGGISLAALFCFLLPGGRRRRLPGMLLVLLAVGLTANLGCSSTVASTITPAGGTPLGTVTLTVNTAGSSGNGSVAHDYAYQVTIQ